MNLVVLILALVVASVPFLAAVLLVPAWLLHRFLCSAHASARRELLASRESSRPDGNLRLVPSSHRS
jgi:hypothetical protein